MDIQKQITFLPTTDLNVTSKFYENILGLKLILDQGDCRIYKTCSNAYLGFCEREFEIIKGKIILTLVVDDVENQYKVLSRNLSKGLSDIVHNKKYNIIHFFVTDPNGYLVEIQKFLNPIE